jgi:hypothetical protein
MDPLTIIALITKGLTIADMAITAGKTAAPIIKSILGLGQAAQDGTVTDEQLAEIEALLDAEIAEFNKPME